VCLITKGESSQNVSDFDSDVSEDLSFESLSLKVAELENVLCNQDKLLCKVFYDNKKLNLELKSSFSVIAFLRPVHNDMSAKPCDNCKMIMINNVGLWLVHAQVASQLDGAKLELRELKICSMLLGACTSCPLLKLIWRLVLLRSKNLSTNLIILHATVFYPLRAKCVAPSRVSFSMFPKRTLS
jgi:hypothetical protein